MRHLWLVVFAAVACSGGTTQMGSPDSEGSAGSAGSGGGTSGTGGMTTPDAGTVIWPADAIGLHATGSGGGELPPTPPDSNCTLGALDYTLEVSTRSFSWTECRAETSAAPWLEAKGTRMLTEAEYNTVAAAMRGLSIYEGDKCGADKPMYMVEVTTPGGTFEYYDSFYACMAGGKVYVEDIDWLFAELRKLSQ